MLWTICLVDVNRPDQACYIRDKNNRAKSGESKALFEFILMSVVLNASNDDRF